MLRNISRRIRASAQERLDATFAAIDAAQAVENLAARDLLFTQQYHDREDREQAVALLAAVKDHGLTPSLMAFANHDGALETIVSMPATSALESLSDSERSRMSAEFVSALEAYLEGDDSDDDSDNASDDDDAEEKKGNESEDTGESEDKGEDKDEGESEDQGDDGEDATDDDDDSDKGDDAETAMEDVVDDLVATGQYLASDATDVISGLKFAHVNRGKVKVHGTPDEIMRHIAQAKKGAELLMKISAMPVPKILREGQKEEFAAAVRAISGDLESLGIEINEKGRLDSSRAFVETKSTRTTKEDSEITADLAKKIIEEQTALRKSVSTAVKTSWKAVIGWDSGFRNLKASPRYLIEFQYILRNVAMVTQRHFRQVTKSARSCRKAFSSDLEG